ncbi:MAG: valine--tRNA ligase [Candidatus Magasanikbacteria bacterium]|nr:valine--tRNA ligase [Candidatus Magasanikbacteria bacterium]NCS71685.1 valine--tRNA ligase [Candidatus Magasanikbacteria bacterium]
MKKELEKVYEPEKYEHTIYEKWESSGLFNPDECIKQGVCKEDAESFSMVLPPPNVTGTLHIGHAVMLAVEDLMVRFHRMKGYKTLWLPGTDHAAIATQEKVEKIMWDEEQVTRHDLGRKKFIDRVDAFAQDSHDTIVNQAKRMGTSLDWSREAFTLDEKRNHAVNLAFNTMYKEELIYRGHRIVNWDSKMQSNVSNIEVLRKTEKAPFYYFQYGPFVIGTARPETKFGDKYIVVHPDDKRYKNYKHGDTFECEWINGKITATVIKDDAIDMEFGTGAMTITPWHDATDFEIAERHSLDKEQVIDLEGKLLPIAGEFAGMPIEEARTKIAKKLKEKGLLVKIDESYEHNIAINSRGKGVIEPQIREQWFVDVKKEFNMPHSEIEGIQTGDTVTLQRIMQHVINTKQIEILPEQFNKAYFNWVDNLRDWCISRQLWYGHQIPAWYREDEIYVGMEAPEGEGWKRDPDTLDTWFSAGMWTFSTLLGDEYKGKTLAQWLADSVDCQTYHPTDVLETGYDILTFWVIRMIMMTTYLTGQIPFKTVYLHGLVRDEHGNKMSKSLGNIIDPLDMCNAYGTDATRLSLLIGATPGNDSRLSEEKIAGFRNFTNKLWNISRFMLINITEPQQDIKTPEPKTLADKWILARLHHVVEAVSADIEQYQFSVAGEKLRDFTWSELADWYLEIAKIEGEKSDILNYILNTILKLWHPYMPFVTEAIWQEVYGKEEMLMVQSWPLETGEDQLESIAQFEIIKTIITNIRALRAEYNIEPAKKVSCIIKSDKDKPYLRNNKELFFGLARLEELNFQDEISESDNFVGFVESGVEVFIDIAGSVDAEKEQERLQKELDHVTPFITMLEKKLSNKGFVDNAPEDVVAQEQAKLEEAKQKAEKLQQQLTQLK